MTDQLEFDIEKARKVRDYGLKQVEMNGERFQEVARAVAYNYAMAHGGYVTNDDVRKHCPLIPHHPNAWGAVIKGDGRFVSVSFKESEAVSRRSGMQRIWRLK